MKAHDVKTMGQVFTPPDIVKRMLALRQNKGSVLEPSAGNGAFLKYIEGAVGVEFDKVLAKQSGATHCDFFALPTEEKFDTIIGNPPYVRYQDIQAKTKQMLPRGFDGRSNLYLFFISKAITHLKSKGEIIFITPREFLKSTSARHLNKILYESGCITHYEELGDTKVFEGYAPNCAIWRWEAGQESREMVDGRLFCQRNGQLWFGNDGGSNIVGDYFDVKVGAVSGADPIFTSERGCTDFVCSKTRSSGETRKMIYNRYDKELEPHKNELLARGIKKFNEANWWSWGRQYCDRDCERVYVNCKTRTPKPFFASDETAYDGSVMALFPKQKCDVGKMADKLNSIDWDELGFVCDGRLQLTQRALENAPVGIL